MSKEYFDENDEMKNEVYQELTKKLFDWEEHRRECVLDMRKTYPKATRNYTDDELINRWESYSDTFAAGWIGTEGYTEKQMTVILKEE